MEIARRKTKGQEKMESREGGNVILQFILEEQLLPHVPDSYQLPLRQRDVKKERVERKTN